MLSYESYTKYLTCSYGSYLTLQKHYYKNQWMQCEVSPAKLSTFMVITE